ncbi:MAG: light-harvesting protein [Piscinibacter sp.]|uniref:light-harvesting protein n=1 Tax=Piscinibacter TaxID=1114981 RepID=UPI000FDF5515|nr:MULTISPECIES: light-harvesting protein [Piscinibacter]MCW5662533.1 light-harvesting protein [Piscinibacter sp.]
MPHHIAREAAAQVLKSESKAFFTIFVVAFTFFLAIALVAQLLTWQWRNWLPGAEGGKSLVGGVKSAVYTFMSHLT